MEMMIRILKTHAMFEEFSDEEFLLIMNMCERQEYKKGDRVFEEAQADHGVYFIEEGIVRITKINSGKEKVIAMFGMGNIFGEMSFLDMHPRSATVTVDEDAVLFCLRPEQLTSLEKNTPRTAVKLLRVFIEKLTARLRQTDDALVEQADRIIIT
ncbi:cyclic nucleotide-binding domain-containing protein [bacterium]|nr:cyclic nucleotide-binding domain-containing protein [bacterium]